MVTKVMYGILDTKTKMYVRLNGPSGCEFSAEPDPRYLYASAKNAFASLSRIAGNELFADGDKRTWAVTEIEITLQDNGPVLVDTVQDGIDSLARTAADLMIVQKYGMPMILRTKGRNEGWIVETPYTAAQLTSIGITKFINLGVESFLLKDEDDVALLALHSRVRRVVNLTKVLDERSELFDKIRAQLLENYTG